MNQSIKFLSYLFSFILLIAIFLRFYQTSTLPPSLNWDEVSIGYNAYSILKTGRDEWGNFMPLSFRAFGDYKLPLYIYLDVPFVAILGLNEIAVRLPSVVSGIGVVVLIFLILKELTKSIYLSLWGMFMSAILPWLVIFSRIALEANLALFLMTAAFYLLLLSFKKRFHLVLATVCLGLSLFSYNSTRVLVFPLLLLMLIVFRSELSKKGREVLIAGLIIFAFIAIALPLMLFTDSSSRYRWTTILDEGATGYINQQRGNTDLPPMLSRLIYNKGTYFLTEATKNYLSHFSADFLFFNGGSNYQFSVPGVGLLYLIILPLFVLGFFHIFSQRRNWQIFVLGWLLLAPLPGAITRDAPHALRTIFMVVPLIIITTLGIDFFHSHFKSKFSSIVMGFLVLSLLFNTFLFWRNYSENYRKNYSWSWQYGYKEALEFVKMNYANYDRVVFSKKYGEPHAFVLFYLKYDPYRYQTDKNLIRYQKSDWFWVDRFDKFEFINDWEVKDKVLGMKNTLLLTSPDNYPKNSQILQTINFLDGKKAFEIVLLR